MACLFRGIEVYRKWNDRIFTELSYVATHKHEIRTLPANGVELPPLLTISRRNSLEMRQDANGYIAAVIHELLELLRNTSVSFFSNELYDELRKNYYGLLRDINDEEEQGLKRRKMEPAIPRERTNSKVVSLFMFHSFKTTAFKSNRE